MLQKSLMHHLGEKSKMILNKNFLLYVQYGQHLLLVLLGSSEVPLSSSHFTIIEWLKWVTMDTGYFWSVLWHLRKRIYSRWQTTSNRDFNTPWNMNEAVFLYRNYQQTKAFHHLYADKKTWGDKNNNSYNFRC